MNKKNLKPMITEEELTEAAKAAYESHKKILYLSLEDAFDIEFPAELEPLAELMYCTGYADAIANASNEKAVNQDDEGFRRIG